MITVTVITPVVMGAPGFEDVRSNGIEVDIVDCKMVACRILDGRDITRIVRIMDAEAVVTRMALQTLLQ